LEDLEKAFGILRAKVPADSTEINRIARRYEVAKTIAPQVKT
jgi:hypothetical protein